MKLIFIFVLLVFGWLPCGAQVRIEVSAPMKRTQLVERAGILSKSLEPGKVDTALKNPFSLQNLLAAEVAPVVSTPPKANRPASDRDFLALLASQLSPTGTFILNGEPIILFGQKRMKVGDRVPLSFDNAVYELEIAGISQTSFTVRFNSEELTRQISAKPSKIP
jgi:hypothetical protein